MGEDAKKERAHGNDGSKGQGLLLDGAGAALVEFATEAFLDKVLETVAERLNADAVDDVAHEGEHEEETSLGFGNATGAHIEEGCLVELAGGGTVRALDIVGVDLKLGTCDDVAVGREDEVAVGLMCIGLVGTLLDEDAAYERATGFFVEDILEKLVALALRCTVTDIGDVIDLLIAVGDAESVEMGVGIVSAEVDIDAVAGLAGGEGVLAYGYVAALLLLDIDRAEATAVGMMFLKLVEVEGGVGTRKDLGDLQAE